MGRAATAIELDAEVRGVLERRAGSLTLPYRVVVRAKLVLLAADSHTNREIAARVDMSADRVADWRKRFAAEGITGLEDRARSGRPCRFPPQEVAQVKAVACELPKTHGVPLSRFSRSELHHFVVEQTVSDASASTIGRWLADDAIGPWRYRSWIFPRDPDFLQKAGAVLDLYAKRWEGKLLEPGDMVISADAKPSIQARNAFIPARRRQRGAASASSMNTNARAL